MLTPGCFCRAACPSSASLIRRSHCPQVGNAFTFGASESGSLTKIQADSTTCGAGSTSTGLGNVLSWASTTPSLGDATDKCIKGWASLGDNTTSIAAIGADGADNVYTLAVNEQTRFAGFLNIYVTPPAGTAPVRAGSIRRLLNDLHAALALCPHLPSPLVRIRDAAAAAKQRRRQHPRCDFEPY